MKKVEDNIGYALAFSVAMFFGFSVLLSCEQKDFGIGQSTTTTTTIKVQAQKAKCAFEQTTVSLINRTEPVKLPAKGLLVNESHYLAKEDSLKAYPKTATEGMTEHLKHSCVRMKLLTKEDIGANCEKVYKASYQKVWTPSEGGNIGQGAIGNVRPEIIQEMFQGTMYFKRASLPAKGEKWIALNPSNGRATVIAMGFEVGPGSAKFLGGISTEAHYLLGSNNSTELIFGKAVDQSLPYGPLDCAQ